MWQYLLFSHRGCKDVSHNTLAEILQQEYTFRAAERLPSNEVRVEISHGGAKRQEFWLDPKVNYLVRKCAWTPAADPSARWEHEVVTFAEPAPGVFVPTTIEVRLFAPGEPACVRRTLITELKVNRPLPAASLRLPEIAGMDCTDLNRDMQYKVDADGNRVGPEKPVRVTRGVPSGAPPAYVEVPPSREPRPWWFWVLVASAAVLLAGLVLGFVRRRRAAQA